MQYYEEIKLKNGKTCILRNGDKPDGKEAFEVFNKTHEETDFLLTYPDENSFNAEEEGEFLKKKTESEREIELVAVIDGKIVGLAGIETVGEKYKVRHRAEFGISILKEYWGLGIGKALTNACISCAEKAGYTQLELDVVSDNKAAVSLYKSFGFEEFGRNPRGFNSRITGMQETVYMRLELDEVKI